MKYSEKAIYTENLYAKVLEAHDLFRFVDVENDLSFEHNLIFRRREALITQEELIFTLIELRAKKLKNLDTTWIDKTLLKCEKIIIALFCSESYVDRDGIILTTRNIIRKTVYFTERFLRLLIEKIYYKIKTAVIKAYRNDPTSNKQLLRIRNFLFETYDLIVRYERGVIYVIKAWIVFVRRFFIATAIHYVPFIQLTSTIFYNYPDPFMVNPVTSKLFHLVPWMLPLLRNEMPFYTNEGVTFLILFPYFYFYTQRRKLYNIKKKTAYQGTFALVLMLLRYSLELSTEVTLYTYKFITRFLFIRKFENLTLLGDDFDFFLEDLEVWREEQEMFKYRNSILLKDLPVPMTNVYQTMSVLALILVIALVYNYVYYICMGNNPIIPVLSKSARRMMADRDDPKS